MTHRQVDSGRSSPHSGWLTRKRAGALLFLAISLFYGAQIQDIQQLPVDELEVMNARSLPWALTGFGVLLSLVLLVTGGATETSQVVQKRLQFSDLLAAGLLLGWTAIYALLLSWLGFWLATCGFLLGGFALLGERGGRALVIAVAVATLLWVLLRFGLGIYLAPGTLLVGVDVNAGVGVLVDISV